jgi:hypothetical protein
MECGNLTHRRSAEVEVGIRPPSNAADLKVRATTGGAVVLVEGNRPQVEQSDGKSRYICLRENASISVSKALTCSGEGASA